VLTQPADPRDATSALTLAYGTEASATDIERFGARFGCAVMEGYGLSEGVLRIGRTPDTPAGALGLPTPGLDVRILDEATGEECPRGTVGQIVARGAAGAFEGYWKNPEAHAQRVRGADFWTGDLGWQDADGWFWFAGRSSDWLRVDGENLAAAPVERVLAAAPGVVAAAVYAVPDPRTGDQVMVTLEADGFDPGVLAAFLEGRDDLGAKAWPRFVRVTERMPLTGSGKVDKGPLRRAAWMTDDPVWVRESRERAWVPLTETHRERLRAELAEHGREGLLHLPG
jgi:fatty-acyl-CoA synthase